MTEAMWVFPAGSKIDAILPDGTHRYWSTHCRHDLHDACAAVTISGTDLFRADGRLSVLQREPAQCKTCGAPCLCHCHKPTEEKTHG